jgi:hypothetical protein
MASLDDPNDRAPSAPTVSMVLPTVPSASFGVGDQVRLKQLKTKNAAYNGELATVKGITDTKYKIRYRVNVLAHDDVHIVAQEDNMVLEKRAPPPLPNVTQPSSVSDKVHPSIDDSKERAQTPLLGDNEDANIGEWRSVALADNEQAALAGHEQIPPPFEHQLGQSIFVETVKSSGDKTRDSILIEKSSEQDGFVSGDQGGLEHKDDEEEVEDEESDTFDETNGARIMGEIHGRSPSRAFKKQRTTLEHGVEKIKDTCCRGLPQRLKDFKIYVHEQKMRVLSMTPLDIALVSLWTIIVCSMLRPTIFSAVYFLTWMIGMPLSVGGTQQKLKVKRGLTVFLVVFSGVTLLTNIVYQIVLAANGMEVDEWGKDCNYFQMRMSDRPIWCMLGIERIDSTNFWLLLPEAAVFGSSLACVFLLGRTHLRSAYEPPYSTSMSDVYTYESWMMVMVFLIGSCNPSFLTLPFLVFYLVCTLKWAFFDDCNILESTFTALVRVGEPRRAVLLGFVNVYSILYSTAYYMYNMRGVPKWHLDILIGFDKMRVFDGLYLNRYIPFFPMIPLAVFSARLWEHERRVLLENKLSKEAGIHKNKEQEMVEMKAKPTNQDDLEANVRESSIVTNVEMDDKEDGGDVRSAFPKTRGHGYYLNYFWRSLTHPYYRFVWCTSALLFGVVSMKITILSLFFLAIFSVGLFYPEIVFHKGVPFTLAYAILYMISLYVGTTIFFLFPDPSWSTGIVADLGITWLPLYQDRMLMTQILVCIFSAVWKAQTDAEQVTAKSFRPCKGVCTRNLRALFSVISFEKYVSLIIYFVVASINVDLLHWTIFTLCLIVCLLKGGSMNKAFLRFWGCLNFTAVAIIFLVCVWQLESLTTVWIALEDFLAFEKLLAFLTSTEFQFSNTTNTTSNHTILQINSTKQSLPSSQSSRMSKYGNQYTVVSMVFETLAVGFAVIHTRLLEKKEKRNSEEYFDRWSWGEKNLLVRPSSSASIDSVVEEETFVSPTSLNTDDVQPTIQKKESFYLSKEILLLRETRVYRMLYRYRVWIFLSLVTTHMVLLLFNVFRYPITLVGVFYLFGALWASSFPLRYTSRKGTLISFEFAAFYGSFAKVVAMVSAFVASVQYLFVCDSMSNAKAWISVNLVHHTLTLENIGAVASVSGAYENMALALISAFIWNIPKYIFEDDMMMDDEQKWSSAFYITFLAKLNALAPFVTSVAFAVFACVNMSFVGLVYMLLALFWHNNTNVKCCTQYGHLIVYWLTPCFLLVIYVWQFPYFHQLATPNTEWLGLHTGKQVNGRYEWRQIIAVHSLLVVLVAVQHLLKGMLTTALKQDPLKKVPVSERNRHRLIPTTPLNVAPGPSLLASRNKKLSHTKVSFLSWMRGWEVERLIAALTLSAVLRGDVMSVCQLSAAGMLMVIPRAKAKQYWLRLNLTFALLLLGQYVVRLGLPVAGYTEGYANGIFASAGAASNTDTGNAGNASLHLWNATRNSTSATLDTSSYENRFAILRWFSFQIDAPIILMLDVLILTVMVAHSKLFEMEDSLDRQEAYHLDISIRNKYNAELSVLSISGWYEDVNDDNAEVTADAIKAGNDIPDSTQEAMDRHSFILPDFSTFEAREFDQKEDFHESINYAKMGIGNSVPWSERIGSHGYGYYKNGKDAYNHFAWFVFRYSRVILTVTTVILAVQNFNVLSVFYCVLSLNVIIRDTAAADDQTARWWWRNLVVFSFFCLSTRLLLQYPMFNEKHTRDSMSALLGIEKSHTYYGGRTYTRSLVISIDAWIFLLAVFQQRLHSCRLYTYVMALKHQEHRKGKLIGQSRFFILELQRLVVQDEIQSEVANIVMGILAGAERRRKDAQYRFKIRKGHSSHALKDDGVFYDDHLNRNHERKPTDFSSIEVETLRRNVDSPRQTVDTPNAESMRRDITVVSGIGQNGEDGYIRPTSPVPLVVPAAENDRNRSSTVDAPHNMLAPPTPSSDGHLEKMLSVSQSTPVQVALDDAKTKFATYFVDISGRAKSIVNDPDTYAMRRWLYMFVGAYYRSRDFLQNQSFYIVLLAMSMTYYLQMTLLSMFYPIFMFVVLMVNPQQLPSIAYAEDWDTTEDDGDEAVEQEGAKALDDVWLWLAEWGAVPTRSKEDQMGPRTRDGLSFADHVFEFTNLWDKNQHEGDHEVKEFLKISTMRVMRGTSNASMLSALVSMIRKNRKRKEQTQKTKEGSYSVDFQEEDLREETKLDNESSFKRCLSRPFLSWWKQETLNPFVQNVPIKLWVIAAAWVTLRIILQFAWQLPNICACYSPWEPSIITTPAFIFETYGNLYPFCQASHVPLNQQKCKWIPPKPGQANFSSFDKMFGVTKVYAPADTPELTHIIRAAAEGNYLNSVGADLFLLCALLFHIRTLKINGAGYIGSYLRNTCNQDAFRKGAHTNRRMFKHETMHRIQDSFAGIFNRFIDSCYDTYYALVNEVYLSLSPIASFSLLDTPRQKPGKDFYGMMIMFQMALMFFVFFYDIGDVNTLVQGGFTFKWSLRVMYVLFCIVFDRIIYMWRSTGGKIVLHAMQLLIFLLCMHHEFGATVFGLKDVDSFRKWLFFLQMPYFYYSSLQISYGYPPFVGDPILLQNETWADSLIWYSYKLMPLVYELKVLLDWYCVDTTMFIYDNIKFEDIRQSIYLVGCGLDYVAREGVRARGVKQPGKCLTGLGSFLLVLALMFTPFFFFSFSDQANVGAPINTVSVRLGVVGYPPMYSVDAIPMIRTEMLPSTTDTERNSFGCMDGSDKVGAVNPPSSYTCLESRFPLLAELHVSDRETIFLNEAQLLFLPWTSGTNWPITTAKREDMLNDVSPKSSSIKNVKLYVQFSFVRVDKKTYTYRRESPLLEHVTDPADMELLLNGTRTSMLIKEFYPRFLRLPRSGDTVDIPQMTGMAGKCIAVAGASPAQVRECKNDAFATCLLTLGAPTVYRGNSSVAPRNNTSNSTIYDPYTVETGGPKTIEEKLIDQLRSQLQLSWSLQCGVDKSDMRSYHPHADNTIGLESDANYEMYVFSSKYSDIVGSYIDVSSIVPLLFLCFVTMGGFIRVFFTGTQPSITFYDWPNHQALKDIVRDIDLSRRIANIDAQFLEKLSNPEYIRCIEDYPDSETSLKILQDLETRIYGKPMMTREFQLEQHQRDEEKDTKNLRKHFQELTVEMFRRAGLEAEEELFRELIDIYRSPERIYEKTGPYRHWWGGEHEIRLISSPFKKRYDEMASKHLKLARQQRTDSGSTSFLRRRMSRLPSKH